MHQDYCAEFVAELDDIPDEQEAGPRIVKHLLEGKRGHYGPLEHPQITFNVGFFPHSVMQQARTHRVGISFDVQSFRYTSDRIIAAANGYLSVDEVFYLRPAGRYVDRQGHGADYTERHRDRDFAVCRMAALRYKELIAEGFAEEQARGILPFDYRQHFVVSFNCRSLMHFLDLRAKADAQLEIRHLCDMLLPKFRLWMPAVAKWYEQDRLGKALLAP
jgi:thymidylate synthase (FAD)